VKGLLNYIILLCLLVLLIITAGSLLIKYTPVHLALNEIIILSFVFTVISLLVVFIFLRGQKRDPDSQTIHTMVSVILKFILELVIAMVWFFIAKKTALTSVILFFILYLAFTLFIIFVILNTLKNKSL